MPVVIKTRAPWGCESKLIVFIGAAQPARIIAASGSKNFVFTRAFIAISTSRVNSVLFWQRGKSCALFQSMLYSSKGGAFL
jgi:hypothetical protein